MYTISYNIHYTTYIYVLHTHQVVLFLAHPQQIVTRYHIIISTIRFNNIMSQYRVFFKFLFLSFIL